MGKIILLALLLLNGVYSLIHPWFGIVIGYLFNILGPQYIWWWNFQGIRPFFLIAFPTSIGFLLSFFRGTINTEIIKNKIVFFAIVYFIFIFLSYLWGPYVDIINKWRFHDAYVVLINMVKVFIFFLMGLCCIDNKKKLKIFSLVFIFSILYMTYWANMQYLSGKFFSRLKGPTNLMGHGLYKDENDFAMLFVTGIPFLFYLGWYFKKRYLKFGVWIMIPFVWHAIFLTASRGGLLGAAFVSLFCGLRCPRRIIGILLILAFVGAFVWQGGSVLKTRAKTIEHYENESSARGRLDAWKAGLRMLITHPITGVGIGSFGPAFPYFSNKRPRVAHNTFIQIFAESGIIAGCSYTLFMLNCVWMLFQRRDDFERNSFCFYLTDATLVSLCGFLTCALFLTLYGFEVQFYLVILANSLIYLSTKRG